MPRGEAQQHVTSARGKALLRPAVHAVAVEGEGRTAADVHGRQFGAAPADSGFEKIRCSPYAEAGVWAGELPVEELGGPHVPADEGRPDVVGAGEVILDVGELHSAGGI